MPDLPRPLFDSDHEMFRSSVRRWLETEAIPRHEQWEKDGQVSREIWKSAGEQGFLCPTVAEEYGGVGGNFLYNTIVDEEVARANTSGLGFGLHSDITTPYLEEYGSEAQKQRYLPGMVSGDIITAIAMTEPGAGSDLQGVKTSAVKDGDSWIINGSKTFITNGQMANMVIVVAKTDPKAGAKGTSLFLVDTDTPGFSRGRNLNKIGLKAQDTSELFFEDMRVPADALLGEEGMGFVYLMQALPQERLNVAIAAVANARGIHEITVEYARERQVFGKPMMELQNTQFELAEMDAQLTAMQVFVDRCIELHLEKKLDAANVAKAKLLSTDLQCKVIDRCVQLHGGYGYMWEYPVARAFADSRVQRIYAGTNEVMKLLIARDL